MNGQPLAEVDLELRSTLKTTKTDKNGNFAFTDVEPGKHSLTALSDGKVIGYLSFELKKDNKADVVLLEDGTYTVSVDKNGAGVELHLVLNEEAGTLAPTEIGTIEKADPNAPQTGDNTNLSWWWLLAVLSATCIVVLEIYHRKKKA
ncbi:MAG: carboxypeptidase-like regulatory domain-containing protein [Acutalibacteraceae bacterium]|nr:carboxypeptidase-like regulatory domain-containing protein [Acutalibacteraceae bacterium]